MDKRTEKAIRKDLSLEHDKFSACLNGRKVISGEESLKQLIVLYEELFTVIKPTTVDLLNLKVMKKWYNRLHEKNIKKV